MSERIGAYTVLRELGRGGMGVVYLAHDAKLDREVAIKVLPAELADDEERVVRFEREAKTLASLNHPNIAQIYGFEEADGKKFLVLEYVEGETLSKRIKAGPLQIDDALEVGKQIAEALEAAHEKGVIHRDLKPANVQLRPDGTVKVLDFGLAKALMAPPSESAIANSPTITEDYTKPGVVLGTAPYMSPEQARGRTLDKRSDIWSFGVVLFECLTGRMLFGGENPTDSMGAIMHKQPDWALLPPNTPPVVQLLLRRCLTKDRKRRLQDIGDARLEIEEAITDPTSSSLGLAAAAIVGQRSGRRARAFIPWAIALLGILAGAAGVWRPWLGAAAPPEPVHLLIAAPEGSEFDAYDISPDGLAIVYCVESDEDADDHVDRPLQLRRLSEPEAIAIRGTEGGHGPAFSPNGRWIAYEKDGVVLRVRLDGSPPVEIARVAEGRWMGSWLNDEELIVGPTPNQLARLDANDGSVEPIEREDFDTTQVFTIAADPTPLTDMLLTNSFSIATGTFRTRLHLLSLESNRSTHLLDESWVAALTPSGHLLFTRDGSLLGVRFDAEQLKVTGEVTSLLAGVSRFKFVPSGTLLHGGSSGPSDESPEIVMVPEEGETSAVLSSKRRDYRELAVSPDGRRIASSVFTFDGGTPRIWLLGLDTGVERPLTPADQPALGAVWSPDGTRIAYAVIEPNSIKVMPIDGSEEPTTLIELDSSKERLFARAWPADADVLIVDRSDMQNSGQQDVLLLSLEDGRRRPILDSEASESVAGLSPDGKVLAYWSDVSGDREIYVQRIDFEQGLVGVRRRVVMPKRFRTVHWSPAGGALLGIDGDGQIWSIAVELEPELTISAPQKLRSVETIEGLQYFSWTPSPDGKGHLFLRDEHGDEKFAQLHVVLNFQTLLDRALPEDGE